MATYVVVRTSLIGLGRDDFVAVVVKDGVQTLVVGETGMAKDLRSRVSLDDSYEGLLHGMTYFTLNGPFDAPGHSAAELAEIFETSIRAGHEPGSEPI